jgi:hypothetical protein
MSAPAAGRTPKALSARDSTDADSSLLECRKLDVEAVR